MTPLAHKIMKRVSKRGRGKWVCTPKDFLGLGSREAVDQALSRLVKAGQLCRVGHGLYDMPRMSDVLKRPAPVDWDAASSAFVRFMMFRFGSHMTSRHGGPVRLNWACAKAESPSSSR